MSSRASIWIRNALNRKETISRKRTKIFFTSEKPELIGRNFRKKISKNFKKMSFLDSAVFRRKKKVKKISGGSKKSTRGPWELSDIDFESWSPGLSGSETYRPRQGADPGRIWSTNFFFRKKSKSRKKSKKNCFVRARSKST